jgi:hypothetical protein
LQGDFAGNFVEKTQHFSKETGRLEKKVINFKCNLLSSASLGKAGFFSSESTLPGLSEMIRHIGVSGCAVL